MNRFFKSTLCLIIMLGCILCLCACGSESTSAPADSTPIKQSALGRFEIEAIEWDDGTKISGDMLQEQIDIMGETFLELYDDNTALLCLYGQRTDMEYSDSQLWNAGNSLFTYEFSVRNGTATLEQDGTTFIFVKK